MTESMMKTPVAVWMAVPAPGKRDKHSMNVHVKPELRFETIKMCAAEPGAESCVPDLLGETVLQNELTFCLDEEDEIYEGYGRRQNAFPYRQRNGYSAQMSSREIKTAVLENAYLKAVFLPEYGGRLWSLTDRRTGRNLLYTNDVLRFRNLAVRNAWFSGGVEWNIGVIGHSPLTTEQMYTAVLKNGNNSPVLRMYEFERVRRLFYQMDFWLDEEDDFLNCRMRVVNENSEVTPMYWWSNIAVPEHPGGRVIVPADRAFTFADGRVYKTGIPMVDGVDVTEYEKIPRSVDYFFDIPQEQPKYIANVDAGGYGLLQLSTKRLRSRKLFSWGHLQGSAHWQEFLTGQAGAYVEIQAGLGKTQYGCLPMAPHTAWEWMERYGAVKIEPRLVQASHGERQRELTSQIRKDRQCERMEELLSSSRAMARQPGEPVYAGSGYGALYDKMYGERRMSAHLEFQIRTESLADWERFMETGVLHEPSPDERPDEFFEDGVLFDLLKSSCRKKNRNNWYARYQLGICYAQRGMYQPAQREFRASMRLRENAWAAHGLACSLALEGRDAGQAREYILKGMQLQKQDIAYLKEGFRLLSMLKAYLELIDFYEQLEAEQQQNSRLKFYYISARCHVGEKRQALELLEQDGGLVPEDMREGETAPGWIWSQANAESESVPFRFDFKTY